MVIVSAGTDTYGRVKSVCGTPIVTKFAMLQFVPIFPLRSFYFTGAGSTQTSGVPLIASFQTSEIQGIQLENIDRTSVFMAYVRAVFATAVIVGFIGVLFPGIMYLTGENLDEFAMLLLQCLSTALIIGIIGGIATYLIPLTTNRERKIRSNCHELLRIAIDPARLPPQTANIVLEFASQPHSQLSEHRLELVRELIRIRAALASATDDRNLESATDDKLFELRQ